MTAKLPAFLTLMQHILEAQGIEPHKAKKAVSAMLSEPGGIPIPSIGEIQQARNDARALDLMNQDVPAEVIARRVGCSRATVYRRANRALKLKRVR